MGTAILRHQALEISHCLPCMPKAVILVQAPMSQKRRHQNPVQRKKWLKISICTTTGDHVPLMRETSPAKLVTTLAGKISHGAMMTCMTENLLTKFARNAKNVNRLKTALHTQTL